MQTRRGWQLAERVLVNQRHLKKKHFWREYANICIFKSLFEYSFQDNLYSAFYDTIVAKQLYMKWSYYNIFIYCRNLIYLTYGKLWLILYIVWGWASSEVIWGVGIFSSQVFEDHLRSFKEWIQTEACVFFSGRNRETNPDIISIAVVPSKQQICFL